MENKWIRLIDNKPVHDGIYRTIRMDYDGKFSEEHLRWIDFIGFQPLNYGQVSESHAINMNVTHWLKIEIPPVPYEEALNLVIETEVFFHDQGLGIFTFKNNIKVFCQYGNATEFITSGVSDSILEEMRTIFHSQMKHKQIRQL